MAYARLTLAEFKEMFPAFSTLTEAQYDAWAAQAEARVGENYGADQQFATELLTAHLLSLNSIGLGSAGAIAATGATSFKSGAFEARISEAVVTQRARGGFAATLWGQQFADIQRRLFGGPRLARLDPGSPCGCV